MLLKSAKVLSHYLSFLKTLFSSLAQSIKLALYINDDFRDTHLKVTKVKDVPAFK